MTVENANNIVNIVSDVLLETSALNTGLEFGYDNYINVENNEEIESSLLKMKGYLADESVIKFRVSTNDKRHRILNIRDQIERQKYLIKTLNFIVERWPSMKKRIISLLGDEYQVDDDVSVIIEMMHGLCIVPIFSEDEIKQEYLDRIRKCGYRFRSWENDLSNLLTKPSLASFEDGPDSISISHAFIYLKITKPEIKNNTNTSSFRKFIKSFKLFK